MERKTHKCDLASGGNEYMLPGLESAKYRSLRNYLGNGFDHYIPYKAIAAYPL